MIARPLTIVVCAVVMIGLPFCPTLALTPEEVRSDTDRDGLNVAQEYLYGTDPNDPDSDGDGAYDGWEVWYDEHRATDKTGAPYVRTSCHFDANYAGDAGVVVYLGNLIQVKDNDANAQVNDPDNDGWNNHHEFLVGSDPTNPNTDGDMYVQDSSDPDPLIANGGDHGAHTGCVQDDHPIQGYTDGNIDGHGNGGGGSGVGEDMAEMFG